MRVTKWSTPLARAAYAGDVAAVTARLDDARVDAAAHSNEALRAACAGGSLDAVTRLLAYHGVEPAAPPHSRKVHDVQVEPLQLAAKGGHQPIVLHLLQADWEGRLAADTVCEALIDASQRAHRGICEALLAHSSIGPNLRALLHAASAGDVDALRAALAYADGADPLLHGHAALRLTAAAGNAEALTALLDWYASHDAASRISERTPDGRVVDRQPPICAAAASAAAAGQVGTLDALLARLPVGGTRKRRIALADAAAAAAVGGHLPLLRHLDEAYAPVGTLLRELPDLPARAAEGGHADVAAWLLQALDWALRNRGDEFEGLQTMARARWNPAARVAPAPDTRLQVLATAAAGAVYQHALRREAPHAYALLRQWSPLGRCVETELATAALSGFAAVGDAAEVDFLLSRAPVDASGACLPVWNGFGNEVVIPAPLHASAVGGSVRIFERIRERAGEDLGKCLEDGVTAATAGSVAIVRHVLLQPQPQQRSNPATAQLDELGDESDGDNLSAFVGRAACAAARASQLGVLDLILQSSTSMEPASGWRLLKAATESDSVHMTSWLLRHPLLQPALLSRPRQLPTRGFYGAPLDVRVLDLLLRDTAHFDPTIGRRGPRQYRIVTKAIWQDAPTPVMERLLADPRIRCGEPDGWNVGRVMEGWYYSYTASWWRLLAEPVVLLTWPLPRHVQWMVQPAMERGAWARRRAAVLAWEVLGGRWE